MLYASLLSLHVVAAILGLGAIVGTTVVAERADAVLVRRFGRRTQIALAVMLVSGALLEWAGGALFHETRWFRASFALLVLLGALQAWILRAPERPRVVWIGRGMCLVVALVAVLMEVKP